MGHDWRQDLGEPRNPENLYNILGIPDTTKKYSDGAEYLCFYRHGIALCYLNDILDSIDFYNYTTGSSSYSTVGKDELPNNITLITTGKEFVSIYGEPREKGGGRQQNMDIWLRWSNMEVVLDSKDWETAQDTTWKTITIYN